MDFSIVLAAALLREFWEFKSAIDILQVMFDEVSLLLQLSSCMMPLFYSRPKMSHILD